MKKIVFNTFIILYIVITIIITYTLLSYNDYHIAELKNNYIIAVEKDLEDYNKGDLLVIKKDNDVKEKDEIIYYDVINNVNIYKFGKIKSIEEKDDNKIITLNNAYTLSIDNILGKKENITSYAYIGSAYSLITSKWGYLIIIIFPIFIAFMLEIKAIFKEVKGPGKRK